jgi:hypothetical protein
LQLRYFSSWVRLAKKHFFPSPISPRKKIIFLRGRKRTQATHFPVPLTAANSRAASCDQNEFATPITRNKRS